MDLTDIINLFINIASRIVPLVGAVAFLVFVWGVAKYIRSAGSGKDQKDSKNLLIWGIIGIFILATAWGIISFLKSEFGFGGDVIVPQINI